MIKRLLSLTLLAALFVGCAAPDDKLDARLKEINEKTQKDLEDLGKLGTDADDIVKKALAGQGCQPGKITIEGILVARQGNQFLLDPRITVSQTSGKRSDGETAPISEDKEVKLSDTPSAKLNDKIQTLKTYVNLGCTDLAAADTANLEEVKLEAKSINDPLVSQVSRTFICGEYKVPVNFMSIVTDELILMDAKISLKSDLGLISIITNSLDISGTSTISTQGLDSSAIVMSAPTINLAVHKELRGQGTLQVSSVGGNYVMKERKEMAAKNE